MLDSLTKETSHELPQTPKGSSLKQKFLGQKNQGIFENCSNKTT